MGEIELGSPLRARNGSEDLDAIIRDGVLQRKANGRPYTLVFTGPEHILTIGPTRSGKGRRLLTPELVKDLDRSIVVVDPKGELAKWTATHRASNKVRVEAIDPFGVLAAMPELRLQSSGYNPMRWLEPGTREAPADDFVDDATAIAEAICPVESQRDPHWEQGAQDIIAGLIMYRRLVDPGCNLAAIRADLARTPRQWRDLILGDDDGFTKEGRPGVELVALRDNQPALMTKLGEMAEITPEDRELNGFVRAAKTQTRFLDSPAIARDLARPGVDFASLKDESRTIYLVLPPVRLVTHARWLRLVVNGAIEALRKKASTKNRPETLIILDEFPQLGKMQSVETGVQLNAGYGIKFWIIIQTITQLEQLYDRNYETFTAAGALTAYAPRDPRTSEYLSKLSGDRTIDVLGESVDHVGQHGSSINRQRRENVMPHEFRQMPMGRMFVRLPSPRHGEELFITEAADFTERDDIPEAVQRLGRR